jgi:hypothetical protein
VAGLPYKSYYLHRVSNLDTSFILALIRCIRVPSMSLTFLRSGISPKPAARCYQILQGRGLSSLLIEDKSFYFSIFVFAKKLRGLKPARVNSF